MPNSNSAETVLTVPYLVSAQDPGFCGREQIGPIRLTQRGPIEDRISRVGLDNQHWSTPIVQVKCWAHNGP